MKLSRIIPRVVVDQNAETLQELIRETGHDRVWLYKLIRTNIKAGRWERVWKKVGPARVPAYRPVKSPAKATKAEN